MTDNGHRGDDPRSPDDIAGVGIPQSAGIDPVTGEPTRGSAGPDPLIRTHDEPPGTIESAARVAADTASGLRDRVADAASMARDQARDTVRKVRERTTDTVEDVRDWATERYDAQSRRAAALAERGYGKLRQGRSATEDFVTENPLLVGVVGLAAGLLLGALLPRTRQEDRTIGPWADEARDQGLRYARDLTQRGREFVETALDPDNLDAAARRSGFAPNDIGSRRYDDPDLRRHRL